MPAEVQVGGMGAGCALHSKTMDDVAEKRNDETFFLNYGYAAHNKEQLLEQEGRGDAKDVDGEDKAYAREVEAANEAGNLDGCGFYVTNADGVTGCDKLIRYGPYQKILIDAPCSTDRHLALKKDYGHWSSKTPKINAERQLELLTSALYLCSVGGEILYSTCALSKLENEEVVENFKKRVEKLNRLSGAKAGTAAEFKIAVLLQRMFLPDEPHGFGPLYVTKLIKLQGPVGVPPP